MAIFNSYVELPEGKLNMFEEFGRRDSNHAPFFSASWAQHLATQ